MKLATLPGAIRSRGGRRAEPAACERGRVLATVSTGHGVAEFITGDGADVVRLTQAQLPANEVQQ